MHVLNYLPLFFGLSSLAFGQTPANGDENEPAPTPEPADTQADSPTPTSPADNIVAPQKGAVEPTAAGEIGVNPVDLPPASYVAYRLVKNWGLWSNTLLDTRLSVLIPSI